MISMFKQIKLHLLDENIYMPTNSIIRFIQTNV